MQFNIKLIYQVIFKEVFYQFHRIYSKYVKKNHSFKKNIIDPINTNYDVLQLEL